MTLRGYRLGRSTLFSSRFQIISLFVLTSCVLFLVSKCDGKRSDWSSTPNSAPFLAPKLSEGVVFATSFKTPVLKVYARRWNGRGPYLQEAANAVSTIRLRSPGVRISLITDDLLPKNFTELFDSVIFFDSQSYSAEWSWRVAALAHTPYVRTVHLDADTKVCSSLSPLFAVARDFDFAATVDPPAEHTLWASYGDHRSFTAHRLAAFNPGTLVYRLNANTSAFILRWSALIERTNYDDMKALIELLRVDASTSWIRLPPEFSLRLNGAHAPFALTDEVKVIHSRTKHTCEMCNHYKGPRMLNHFGILYTLHRLPGVPVRNTSELNQLCETSPLEWKSMLANQSRALVYSFGFSQQLVLERQLSSLLAIDLHLFNESIRAPVGVLGNDATIALHAIQCGPTNYLGGSQTRLRISSVQSLLGHSSVDVIVIHPRLLPCITNDRMTASALLVQLDPETRYNLTRTERLLSSSWHLKRGRSEHCFFRFKPLVYGQTGLEVYFPSPPFQ